MSEELKPVRCGCGGEAHYEAYENYNFGSYIAHIMICDKCGMRTAEWPSEAEAIMAWNRAMSKQAPLAKVNEIATRSYCGECGERLDDYDDICGEPPIKYCPMCGARLEWE